MTSPPTFAPFPDAHAPTGHVVGWRTWDDAHAERTVVRWENEGFTVQGRVERERVEYVVRTSSAWEARQLLVFRDLDEPDLWLITDGHGRWAEQSGARRPELDGCRDVELTCTPFTMALPLRRLPLPQAGDGHVVVTLRVDPDTLECRRAARRYTRVGDARWRLHDIDTGDAVEFDVDAHGLARDVPGAFRRLHGDIPPFDSTPGAGLPIRP